ncbi:MAG: TlyA family RNA methyltransferase [Candidatus Nanopelagicales bacterium]
MRRLDAELVTRGLARSRAEAQLAITEGRVVVEGMPATKAARTVSPQSSIKLVELEKSYVSRGAFKLIGALDAFGIDVAGAVVLDAGASTGGFTEVVLERGAAQVLAVDVGYGQLAWSLRSDDRVVVMERTNVRHLEPEMLSVVPNLIVADLSFISLTSVLPALSKVVAPSGEMVLMVKPQFEAGKAIVNAHHGVIKDPEVRVSCVVKVAQCAIDAGWLVAGIAASPLPGPKGNVEYFLWLSHSFDVLAMQTGEDAADLEVLVSQAVALGPS